MMIVIKRADNFITWISKGQTNHHGGIKRAGSLMLPLVRADINNDYPRSNFAKLFPEKYTRDRSSTSSLVAHVKQSNHNAFSC